MDRCKKCGEKFVRFPLKDEQGKIIWKNFFKMDMMSVFFLVCIILMIIGYKADMKQCEDAIEKPCEFCEKTNCCIITRNMTEQQYEAPELEFNINR